MADNLVVIRVYADRIDSSTTPKVRARVEPMTVVIEWLDDNRWEHVDVGRFRRIDRSPVTTVPPEPSFRHGGTKPVQEVNFAEFEKEDVGATYTVTASSPKTKAPLHADFNCWLLGFNQSNKGDGKHASPMVKQSFLIKGGESK